MLLDGSDIGDVSECASHIVRAESREWGDQGTLRSLFSKYAAL